MKKSILNVGKALNIAEQKSVNGGAKKRCLGSTFDECQGPGFVWTPDGPGSTFGSCCFIKN